MQGMVSRLGPPHATGVWTPVIQSFRFAGIAGIRLMTIRLYDNELSPTNRQNTVITVTGKSTP